MVPASRVKGFQDTDFTRRCDPAHHEAYLVLEGKVAVRETSRGLNHVVDLGRTRIPGELRWFLGVMRPRTTATALGSVRVCAIDTAMFNAVIESDAEVGYAVLKSFSKLMVVPMDRRLEHLLA